MTKYIIHGGNTRAEAEDNSNFFKEIVLDVPLRAKILGVYFACPQETWAERFNFFKMRIVAESQRDDFEFILADEARDVFIEQIKQADVVYLHGGYTSKLQKYLSSVADFAKLLENKIVAGSSAGVYVLSKYYYSNSRDNIFEGLGILPIKTFCHYNDFKREKLKRLEDYGEKLETYAMPEGKYFIINQ